MIVGHAAVFDQATVLIDAPDFRFEEVIRPGAFTAAISEQQNVAALFNHEANFILGRTSSSTLRLREDSIGLATEIDLLGTNIINELVVRPLERGDLSGMSFAFLPRNDGTETERTEEDGTVVIERPGERITLRREGDKLFELRELLAVDLFDVSVVAFPAYPQTEAGLRGAGAFPSIVDEARQRLADRQRRNRVAMMRARLRLAERS